MIGKGRICAWGMLNSPGGDKLELLALELSARRLPVRVLKLPEEVAPFVPHDPIRIGGTGFFIVSDIDFERGLLIFWELCIALFLTEIASE